MIFAGGVDEADASGIASRVCAAWAANAGPTDCTVRATGTYTSQRPSGEIAGLVMLRSRSGRAERVEPIVTSRRRTSPLIDGRLTSAIRSGSSHSAYR